MTDPTPAVVDTDTLPPTQYLILEVLAARHRLGEVFWTFPKRLRPHLDALTEAGLVNWESAVTPGNVRVSLTEAGKAAVLLETYAPPALGAALAECEHRTEWATHLAPGGEYAEEIMPSWDDPNRTAEERARLRAEHWRSRIPDGKVTVLRREIYTTPWREADHG